MNRFWAVVAAGFLSFGCSREEVEDPMSSTDRIVATVRVYTDGRVTLDGESVTFEELRSALASLKLENGVVWYYREAGEREPHPNATEAMQAVVEAQVPISFSDQEDFSTVVTPDGRSSPR